MEHGKYALAKQLLLNATCAVIDKVGKIDRRVVSKRENKAEYNDLQHVPNVFLDLQVQKQGIEPILLILPNPYLSVK